MADMEWGFNTNFCKWALYERAPLTITGYNEIIAMGRTRSEVLAIAKVLGIRLGIHSNYAVVKMESIRTKIVK